MPGGLLPDLFRGLPQQGPGSDASTSRALAFLPELGTTPRILDVGCGSGRQTLALARQTGGTIVAVDLLEELLEQLRAQAAAEGVDQQIDTRCKSMADLDFAERSFDLIWSEGAIYNMGFQAGLEAWRPLLRDDGVVAVTELTWLTHSPPAPAVDFWSAAYPGMGTLDENRRRTVAAGFHAIRGFVLPEEDWWSGYYGELERRILERRPRTTEPAALAVLDQTQGEIDLFRAREGSYGYVFYLMRLAG